VKVSSAVQVLARLLHLDEFGFENRSGKILGEDRKHVVDLGEFEPPSEPAGALPLRGSKPRARVLPLAYGLSDRACPSAGRFSESAQVPLLLTEYHALGPIAELEDKAGILRLSAVLERDSDFAAWPCRQHTHRASTKLLLL